MWGFGLGVAGRAGAFLLGLLLTAGAAADTTGFSTAEARRLLAGTWLTEDGEGLIEIYPSGDGAFAGRVLSGSDEGLRDSHNPDPALRGRPVKGLEILSGFRQESAGRFTGGRIYDPSSGNTYRARITLTGPDTLRLRGYIGIPLLGGSQTWTRAAPEHAPAAAPSP